MTKTLRAEEIRAMRDYLTKLPPLVGPPAHLPMFDVERICKTLETFLEAEQWSQERVRVLEKIVSDGHAGPELEAILNDLKQSEFKLSRDGFNNGLAAAAEITLSVPTWVTDDCYAAQIDMRQRISERILKLQVHLNA